MSNKLPFYLIVWMMLMSFTLIFPIMYGYNFNTTGQKFLGITGIYPTEQYYYFSVGAAQGAKGAWVFADKYDRIGEKRIYVNPIANLIVLIQKVTQASLPIAFNIFRIISSLLLLFAFYHLAKQFIPSSFSLLATIILYSLYGGVDYLFKELHIWQFDPLDDSFPAANMFLSMNGEYYHPFSNALFILTMSFGYKVVCKQERATFITGLLLFLLGVVYVYGMIACVIILALVSGIYGWFERNLFLRAVSLVKICLWGGPVILYYLWLLFLFPTMADEGWFQPPRFASVVLTFGFVFLFALSRVIQSNFSIEKKEVFLCLWAVITLIFVQIPTYIVPFQTQMIIGLGAPLCILSGMFVSLFIERFISRIEVVKSITRNAIYCSIFLIVISLSSLTNIKFYFNQLNNIKNRQFPYFIETEIANAIDWSNKNISEHKLVVVSNKLAFIFSGSTACRVYNGVAPDNIVTKQQIQIQAIITSAVENDGNDLGKRIKAINADYIFIDKSLAGDNFESVRNYFSRNFATYYQNNKVSIYKLK